MKKLLILPWMLSILLLCSCAANEPATPATEDITPPVDICETEEPDQENTTHPLSPSEETNTRKSTSSTSTAEKGSEKKTSSETLSNTSEKSIQTSNDTTPQTTPADSKQTVSEGAAAPTETSSPASETAAAAVNSEETSREEKPSQTSTPAASDASSPESSPSTQTEPTYSVTEPEAVEIEEDTPETDMPSESVESAGGLSVTSSDSIDPESFVATAREVCTSLGFEVKSGKSGTWDTPLILSSKTQNFRSRMETYLRDYNTYEGCTAFSFWYESIGNGRYHLYIGR